MIANTENKFPNKSFNLLDLIANKVLFKSDKLKTRRTFYAYFRPIALFCRSMGILPLKNLHDSNSENLEFSCYSIPLAYTFILFTTCIVLLILLSNWSKVHELVEHAQPEFMWRYVLMIVMIVRSLICWFFCVYCSKKFVKLIRILDLFDAKRSELSNEVDCKCDVVKIYEYTVKPLVWKVTILIVTAADLFVFSHSTIVSFDNPNNRMFAFLIFGLLGIWQVMPLLLYTYFVKTIKKDFETINEVCSISRGISYKDDVMDITNVKDMLENVRLLRVMMSDAVKYLNNSYGFFLAMNRFYFTMTFVINSYVFFFTTSKDLILLIDIILHGFLLVIVVFSSDNANSEVRFR